jgi:hypothetical protein
MAGVDNVLAGPVARQLLHNHLPVLTATSKQQCWTHAAATGHLCCCAAAMQACDCAETCPGLFLSPPCLLCDCLLAAVLAGSMPGAVMRWMSSTINPWRGSTWASPLWTAWTLCSLLVRSVPHRSMKATCGLQQLILASTTMTQLHCGHIPAVFSEYLGSTCTRQRMVQLWQRSTCLGLQQQHR